MSKISLLFSFAALYGATLNAACVFQKPIEVTETSVGNVISWTTATETENKRFIIEKSSNGTDFVKIGEVNGAINSAKESKYRFLDVSIGEVKTFYRIAHLDNQEKLGYTPIFIVNRQKSNNFVITGMSSLRTDSKLSFTIRSAVEGNLKYVIKTIENRKVFENELAIIDGANIVSIDVSILNNANYLIDFVLNNEKEHISFEKVDNKDVPKIDYVVKE